jgi:chromosomal replication initiation ATPase DnaA
VLTLRDKFGTESWPPSRESGDAAEVADRVLALVESIVARVYMVEHGDLHSPTRGLAHVAHARQIAMYLAHVICGVRLADVGRGFGRDRTTVAHACEAVEDRRDDPTFDLTLEQVVAILRRLCDLTFPSCRELRV